MSLRWASRALVALLPFLLAAPATADPTTSADATASADTTAGAAAAPVATTPLASIEVPKTASPRPDRAEWKGAVAVSLATPLPPECTAQLLREWLRLRCSGSTPASGAVLSGSDKDVYFFPDAPINEFGIISGSGVIEALLPLRPGEARIVQLTRTNQGDYYGGILGQELWLTIAQHWPASSKGPIVRTDHRTWNARDVFGMRIGTVAEAKALGLKTAWSDRIVISVSPSSPADKGGAKPGDNVASGEERWPEALAFDDGPVFSMLVLRNGTEKLIYFARRQGAKW